MQEKTNFGSKLGGVLAAAGSAVGLGNIWRFPTETGEHGGAAFLLIYIAFMILFGVPVMISELSIGRFGGSNVSHSFRAMGGHRAWGIMGAWPILAGLLVLSYYSVVAGWILEYLYEAVTNTFAGLSPEQITNNFVDFSGDVTRPIVCLFIMIAATCAIVAMGVQKGIERGSRIMMPVLFICLLFLVGCSLFLPGAGDGLRFLFQPDFSKVTGATILSAMGQAFFSLSVGLCCLCTYGCYFRKDVNIIKDSLSVASIDTIVAMMAGLIIFPAVYSVAGLQPDAGPGLIFITLPNVFQQILPGVPDFAYCFSLMFYLLLVVAALTSSISMLEMAASVFIRKFGVSRPVACITITLICFVLGIACSLSFGVWSDVTIFGMDIFTLFDYLVAKFLMPIGAMIISVFVGWVVDKNVLRNELTNGGTVRQPLFATYRFIVRYLAPVLIALIFLNEMGVF